MYAFPLVKPQDKLVSSQHGTHIYPIHLQAVLTRKEAQLMRYKGSKTERASSHARDVPLAFWAGFCFFQCVDAEQNFISIWTLQ